MEFSEEEAREGEGHQGNDNVCLSMVCGLPGRLLIFSAQ